MRFGARVGLSARVRLNGAEFGQFAGTISHLTGDENVSITDRAFVEFILESESRENALGEARASVGAALREIGLGDLELESANVTQVPRLPGRETDLWEGAKLAAIDVLAAVRKAKPGRAVADPLDDEVVHLLDRAADGLGGYPDTADLGEQLKEMSLRYTQGRPDAGQWKLDHRFALSLQEEIHARLTGK